jgi:hypothetical protein
MIIILDHSQFNKMHYSQDICDRFWYKVNYPGNDDECWEWIGYRNDKNYGRFGVNWVVVFSHRFAYEYYNGPIPPIAHIHILHDCDNPPCCNPNHLFLGTDQDNMTDKVNKNRQLKGEKVGNSILTEQDILDIFEGIKAKKFTTITQISSTYNVHRGTILAIINRINWTHLTEKMTDRELEDMKNFLRPHYPIKLNKNIVRQIKQDLNSNLTLVDISKKYNISSQLVARIRDKKLWIHVI